jgi:hypothetical protein
MAAKDQPPKGPSKQDHAERAAAALRENLRKRKAQQRERAEQADPATARDDRGDEEKKWGK